MDEPEVIPEPEIVDKDTLPAFLSISIGAAATFLLGFVIPFLNYLVGAVAVVFHYTLSNRVSVKPLHGVRIAFMGTFMGALLILVAWNIMYYNQYGLDISAFKEDVIVEMEKRGNDEQIEIIEEAFPDRLTVGMVVFFDVMLAMVFAFVALIASLAGGWLGATLFKKGPLAQ